MRILLKGAVLAALTTCMTAVQVSAQGQFCTAADGNLTIGFGTKPATVVHDETLGVTFQDAGIPNAGGEDGSLFSFARTIDAILISAGALAEDAQPEDRHAARVAFLDTMKASFDPAVKVRMNPTSAILVPVDDRSVDHAGEGALDSAQLLDPASPIGMVPLALFNRVDLAPADWANCGEFRVVYGKRNPGFLSRFLLIFEAVMPNPAPAQGQAGCLPFLGEWASLGADPASRVANATKLSTMYYDGIASGGLTYQPVVSFRNLGGDGSGGQVRGNFFMADPWQLREWLTQLTLDGDEVHLAFVPETVKNNPIAELYLDELAGDDEGQVLADVNIPVALDRLRGDFITHFATTVQNNLFVERSSKFADRVDDANSFTNADLSEDSIVLNMIGLGSSREFDEFQSSSDAVDNIASGDNTGDRFRELLKHLLARPETTAQGGGLPAQNVPILLNRALGGTCAGCHQTAAGEPVKIRADGTALEWPQTPGFVHVTEDRELSAALEDHFLPFRRLVMARLLCSTSAMPAHSAATAAARAPYYVDEIIAEGRGPAAPATMAAGAGSGPIAALGALVPEERRRKIVEISRRIRAERQAEQAQPGAFVEVRRPH